MGARTLPVYGGSVVTKLVAGVTGWLMLAAVLASVATAQLPTTDDPRAGLSPGFDNPGVRPKASG